MYSFNLECNTVCLKGQHTVWVIAGISTLRNVQTRFLLSQIHYMSWSLGVGVQVQGLQGGYSFNLEPTTVDKVAKVVGLQGTG